MHGQSIRASHGKRLVLLLVPETFWGRFRWWVRQKHLKMQWVFWLSPFLQGNFPFLLWPLIKLPWQMSAVSQHRGWISVLGSSFPERPPSISSPRSQQDRASSCLECQVGKGERRGGRGRKAVLWEDGMWGDREPLETKVSGPLPWGGWGRFGCWGCSCI